MKKRSGVWGYFLFIGMFLLVGAPAWAQSSSWTVAIYINADHNLDESSVADVEEMKQVGSAAGFNIVVQWDRAGDGGVVRGLVQKGEVKVVQQLPELNSDDPKNLQDFMDWVFKNYKADRYGVVLWDHGGNWDGGFGGDETPGSNESMSPIAVNTALAASLKNAGVKQLEFLSYDTCLMGSIELLGEYANITPLYIANPEIDYGDGWDYTATLGYLKATPNVDMQTFGKAEVGQWQKHHQQKADLEYGAHGAYWLANLPKLYEAIDALSKGLMADNANATTSKQMAAIRAKTIEYFRDTEDTKTLVEPRPYADIGQFAGLLSQQGPDDLKPLAQAVAQAVGSVVLARATGSKTKNGSTLSVWFPLSRANVPDQSMLDKYATFAISKQTAWGQFIGQWTGYVKAENTKPTVTAPKAPKDTGKTYAVEFSVKGEKVDTLVGYLSREEKDGLYTLFGQVFYESGSEGDYTFDWDKRWWRISDGKVSTFVSAFYSEPNDSLLGLDAMYQPPKGKAFQVSVLFDSETGEVVGALDNSGLSPTDINLEPGGSLRPLLTLYNPDKDDYSFCNDCAPVLTIPSGGIKALKMDLAPLPSGKYKLAVGGIDYFGNEQYEFVDVTLK